MQRVQGLCTERVSSTGITAWVTNECIPSLSCFYFPSSTCSIFLGPVNTLYSPYLTSWNDEGALCVRGPNLAGPFPGSPRKSIALEGKG